MASAVLDTSAVLAIINDEPGADMVSDVVEDAMISAVNFAEVISKLVQKGLSQAEYRAALGIFGFEIVDLDRKLAEATGAMVSRTRRNGLSLGDRACLSLAEATGIPVLTADTNWSLADVECEIRFIR